MIWEGEKDTIPLHCRPCTATGDGRANDVILTSAHTLQQVYGKTSLRTTDTSAYEETDEHHYWVCATMLDRPRWARAGGHIPSILYRLAVEVSNYHIMSHTLLFALHISKLHHAANN